MNRVADDLILSSLERTEDYIHTCADAVDAKAGQVLSAGAFLAIQPAVLLVIPNLNRYFFAAQIASFVSLLAAAVAAHLVLRIDDYPSPQVTEGWRDTVTDARLEDASEESVARTILWGIVTFAKDRVTQGQILNARRIRGLQWARGLTAAAFLVNAAIICGIMISRFF